MPLLVFGLGLLSPGGIPARVLAQTGPQPQAPPAASLSADPQQVRPVFLPHKNARIAVLGAASAHGIFQEGFLETLLQAAFPEAECSLRNLALPGETILPKEGTQARDTLLATLKADTFLLFFGTNEALRGKAGLTAFQTDLFKLVKKLKAGGRTGSPGVEGPDDAGPAQVILFSPSSVDASGNPAEMARINEARKLYAHAVEAVARETDCLFVDTHVLSEKLLSTNGQRSALLPARWGRAANALETASGYPTTEAHRLLAVSLFETLTGRPAPAMEALAPLLEAVRDKNALWETFHRSSAHTTGNAKELAALQSALHPFEQAVWRLAQGNPGDPGPAAPGRTPPAPKEVGTRQQTTPAPDSHLKVLPGLLVRVFASSDQFPELRAPIQLDWDTEGRLGVLCRGDSSAPRSDQLLLLEDSNHDGSADSARVFAENLHGAGAFVFHRDGALIEQAGDLWLVRDPLRTGNAQERERVLAGTGLPARNAQTGYNRLMTDPGGSVYWSDPGPHRARLETLRGVLGEARGTVYKFHPYTGRVETLLVSGLDEAPGSLFTERGAPLFTDRAGLYWYTGSTLTGRSEPPPPESNWPRLWEKVPAPITGAALVHGNLLPEDLRGALLATTLAKPAGIRRAAPPPKAAAEILSSSDPAFHPVALACAPDGSLFFADSRKENTRIYRITTNKDAPSLPDSAPAVKDPPESDPGQLLERLKSAPPGMRALIRQKLGTFKADAVAQAINKWLSSLKDSDADRELLLLEALWIGLWFDKPDPALLQTVLHAKDPSIRAQAVRVLAEARSTLSPALRLLEEMAADTQESVRLEVLAAAGTFPKHDKAGVKLVHKVLLKPLDASLERVAKETLRQLEPDPARLLLPEDASVARFVLGRLSNAELGRAPKSEPVWIAQIERAGIPSQVREQALQSLATKRSSHPLAEIANALARLDAADPSSAGALPELIALLLSKNRDDFAQARPALEELAAKAKNPALRRSAHAAWLQSAPATEIWTHLKGNEQRQIVLLSSLPLVKDAPSRAQLHPILAGLLKVDAKASPSLRAAVLRALPMSGPQFAKENLPLLCSLLARGDSVPETAAAIAQLPESTLEAADLTQPLRTLTEWIKARPDSEKSTPQFAQTLQLASSLAALWEAQMQKTLQTLRSQSTSVRVIRAVFEQSRFDTARLRVAPGAAFTLVFENADVQPQNLVLIEPGSRAKVRKDAGLASEPDAQGRRYIPASGAVIAATRVLEPGESQSLEIKAPEKEGEYELICTIPGRSDSWRSILAVEKDDPPRR